MSALSSEGPIAKKAEIASAAPSYVLCSDGRKRIPWTKTVPGQPLVLADGQKRCGALKRGDKFDDKRWACANLPSKGGNGRCKFHGGLNTGTPIKTGLHSKKLPRGWYAGYEASKSDPEAATLIEELHVLNGALNDALAKISDGCTDQQIARIKELFDETTMLGNVEALKEMGAILTAVEPDPEASEAYFALVERKVKVVEALSRKDARESQQHIIREVHSAASVMIAILIQVVNDETVDRKFIPQVVGQRFAQHFGRPSGLGAD